jgi:hypothetical protein
MLINPSTTFEYVLISMALTILFHLLGLLCKLKEQLQHEHSYYEIIDIVNVDLHFS